MPYIDDLNLHTTLRERTVMKMKTILEFMNKHRGLFDTKTRSDFRNKYYLVRKQQGSMDPELVELVDKYSKKIEEMQSIYTEAK